MRTPNSFCLMWILILLVVGTGLAGCAFDRVNLVEEGVVAVERVDPETPTSQTFFCPDNKAISGG